MIGNSECTFLHPPPPKRRVIAGSSNGPSIGTKQLATGKSGSKINVSGPSQSFSRSSRLEPSPEAPPPAFDYPQESILTKTLGLEKSRFSEYVGQGGEQDVNILYGQTENGNSLSTTSRPLRWVHEAALFQMTPDNAYSGVLDKSERPEDVKVEDIEQLAHPHGPALIKLYFRICHPSFPILHKEVFVEKYNRTYREITPHLLAAVYALAARWWSYDTNLLLQKRLDEAALVLIAHRAVQESMHRPRLNTVQAGLLLLQRHRNPLFTDNSWTWSFTASLIGLGQHLGLHLDCSHWNIPEWEKGLRKRLAWALFTQDAFSAMILGRPCLISLIDWDVKMLTPNDFSESSVDEDSSENAGSASIEDGKTLFIETVKLGEIASRVLRELYSTKAMVEITEPQEVLACAKPLGTQLADLLRNLPSILRMDNLQPGRLCANGYYHLAHQATTVALHRRLLWSISRSTSVDSQFVQFLRGTQLQRARSIVKFISSLKSEHMEAFWFFAAGGCATMLGSFLGLLRVTSETPEESEELKKLMREFEWQLRMKAKMGEWVSYTLTRLRVLGWDHWKDVEPDVVESQSDNKPSLREPIQKQILVVANPDLNREVNHEITNFASSNTMAWTPVDFEGFFENLSGIDDGLVDFTLSPMMPGISKCDSAV
ncbi:MAG: hypothetical protein M1834_006950 [Cirrosporium novae-zelandiae]|nr:MAG: hypothetical protein M1834_006950 [Cirrosporium novae-zelandiae]